MKILILQSSPKISRAFQGRLEALGHKIYHSQNGQELKGDNHSIVFDILFFPESSHPVKNTHILEKSDHLFMKGASSPLKVLAGEAISAVNIGAYLKMGFDACISLDMETEVFNNQMFQIERMHAGIQQAYLENRSGIADPLATAINRVQMRELVEETLAHTKLHDFKAAILHVDIDNFRNINEALGEGIGDQLISLAYKRIKNSVRVQDAVFSIGGNEFLVVTGELESPEDARIIAKNILDASHHNYEINSYQLSITFSIGISYLPAAADNAEALLQAAYRSMRESKNSGKNCYQFFNTDLQKNFQRKAQITYGLMSAIRNKEFSLNYQPIFDLSTNKPVGAEALIRWNHPTLGPLSPAEFIPIAEKNNMIIPIGKWVYEEVFRLIKKSDSIAFSSQPISINISPYQLSETFVSDVMAILNKDRIPLQSIIFELTETAIINNESQVAWEALTNLHKLGFKIHADDFGAGYSSLSHLKHLPFSAIKIDQSFIMEFEDRRSAAIVSSMIRLAKELNLKVIAEGIETEKQLAFLQAHKCEHGQGYYLRRPMDEKTFLKYLKPDPSGEKE